MTTLMSRLADWSAGLEYGAIPIPVREIATRAFIDTCGVMVAGATDEIATNIRRWVEARPRPGASNVPPFGLTTDPENAALALGVLAHALDFDDIHPALLGHPSAVIVPTVLALGSFIGASGERALTAYVAGAEAAARLGRALAVTQYNRGWHTTSSIGVLGAAVAAANLLRLAPDASASAIGLAASTASGLRANFGSSAKPLHAGYAAYHAVASALFARAGLSAAQGALDGPLGYLESFTGNRALARDVDLELNGRWELQDPGLQVKAYPCCGGAHRSIDALADLARERRLKAEDVVGVTALTDPLVPTLLVYPEPRTIAEARFSLQHCLAAVLADGDLSLRHFTEASLGREDLRRLRGCVKLTLHPDLRDYRGELAFSEVQVALRDGSTLSWRADFPRGSAQRPLSQSELEKKYLDCARLYAPDHDWMTALRSLQSLADLPTVQALLDSLVVAR